MDTWVTSTSSYCEKHDSVGEYIISIHFLVLKYLVYLQKWDIIISYGNPIFNCFLGCLTVSHSHWTILHFYQHCTKSSTSPHPHWHMYISGAEVNSSHPKVRGNIIPLCIWYYFPIVDNARHLFICISLEKYLCDSFAHVFMRLFISAVAELCEFFVSWMLIYHQIRGFQTLLYSTFFFFMTLLIPFETINLSIFSAIVYVLR